MKIGMSDDASSPLAAELRKLIATEGPLSVAQFMSLCLGHPRYGYYVTRDPLGARGDFITAPEISQMFGELLGLWALAVWRMMGAPDKVHLVELGPGRGTLMRDALRALRNAPDFCRAIELHLVEVSPVLERKQRAALVAAEMPAHWHKDFSELPMGPTILLANEFVDALPVHQAVRTADGWHERVVGLDAEGHFVFGLAGEAIPGFERLLPETLRDAPPGSIHEWRNESFAVTLGERMRERGAALIVDYGHCASAVGDTLQALSRHRFTDVLAAPGEADLTAHVDFAAFGKAAARNQASVQGPLTQGEFLQRLGIGLRAQALKAKASARQAADIDAALSRLTQKGSQKGSNGMGNQFMGELFKVMAIADPRLGALPGFEGAMSC